MVQLGRIFSAIFQIFITFKKRTKEYGSWRIEKKGPD